MIAQPAPHRRGSLVAPQYVLVQGSILGGQPAANSGVGDNPNAPITPPGRYVSIVPLAGAAAYPISLVMDDGSIRTVFDSRPFDSGSALRPSGQLFRVQPQTFAQAFGGVGTSTGGGINDGNVTNALFPNPTNGRKFVAGSIAGSAGYVSGLFGIEASDDPAFFASGPGLVSPFTYCAIRGNKLVITAPSSATPIFLPDFANYSVGSNPPFGGSAFLGAGQGVVRHTFGGTFAKAHVLYKWFIDPLSGQWNQAGSLNIGPNATPGAVAVIEETVNLALPTWMYLQLDANENNLADNPVWIATITRGGQ